MSNSPIYGVYNMCDSASDKEAAYDQGAIAVREESSWLTGFFELLKCQIRKPPLR